MHVTDLFIYPLKSARGIALEDARIDAYGLIGDRRAMLVDPEGQLITQREMPALARLIVAPTPGALHLGFDGRDDTIVVAPPHPQRRMDVVVWKSPVSAAVAEDDVNERLSAWFERPVLLVFFDAQSQRIASPDWPGAGTPVTFADGYQILVTTTGSLAALNADMARHDEGGVAMDRFRPNIVIDCDEPWAEDRWSAIEIGGIRLDLVKPCVRCIMTTQDQQTGSREGPNPIPAMGRIRMSIDRRAPGPLFGWNAVPQGGGTIGIGVEVSLIEERSEGWPIKVR